MLSTETRQSIKRMHAEGSSVTDIAKALSISRTTVYAYMRDQFRGMRPQRRVHNPEIFVREIQTLRTLVRHFHTGAILKSHTAVHIFSYENPEITYTEQEKY